MSNWTHCLCDDCWDAGHEAKSGRQGWGPLEKCCQCGAATKSGIYYRADPETMPNCGGHSYA
jgi:hypothetical protein